MKTLENFEQVGRRGFYRPIGTVTFERAVDMVAEGIHMARMLGLADVIPGSSSPAQADPE